MAIITVSRQVGSFGDEIAALVAQKLGHTLVSRERVHELAQSCDEGFKDACSIYEKEVQPGFFERFFFNSPAYTSLFESLNYELASRGDVVVIGRGGQIVLHDVPGILKIRVVAPLDVRIKRVAKRENMPVDMAGEYVRKYDHQREALVRTIFDKDLQDWSLYDFIINTAQFSAQSAADIICRSVEMMHVEHTEEDVRKKLELMAFAKSVESAIKKEIVTSPYRNILVSAEEGGTVTISGFVQELRSKERAEKIAKKFDRVKEVKNDLRTTELRF